MLLGLVSAGSLGGASPLSRVAPVSFQGIHGGRVGFIQQYEKERNETKRIFFLCVVYSPPAMRNPPPSLKTTRIILPSIACRVHMRGEVAYTAAVLVVQTFLPLYFSRSLPLSPSVPPPLSLSGTRSLCHSLSLSLPLSVFPLSLTLARSLSLSRSLSVPLSLSSGLSQT